MHSCVRVDSDTGCACQVLSKYFWSEGMDGKEWHISKDMDKKDFRRALLVLAICKDLVSKDSWLKNSTFNECSKSNFNPITWKLLWDRI